MAGCSIWLQVDQQTFAQVLQDVFQLTNLAVTQATKDYLPFATTCIMSAMSVCLLSGLGCLGSANVSCHQPLHIFMLCKFRRKSVCWTPTSSSSFLWLYFSSLGQFSPTQVLFSSSFYTCIVTTIVSFSTGSIESALKAPLLDSLNQYNDSASEEDPDPRAYLLKTAWNKVQSEVNKALSSTGFSNNCIEELFG